MDKLVINPTETTPEVILDHLHFRFEIKGEVSPENARDFFSPILAWFDEMYKYLHYADSLNTIKREFNLVIYIDYITSSSLKCIYDVLRKVLALQPYVSGIKITWLYDEGDEDMKESGTEFSKMLDIPFEIKPVS